MSAEIISIAPEAIGDGHVIDCDAMLEANKGVFRIMTIIGEGHDGRLVVRGSHGAPDSAFLMLRGQAFLVDNEVARQSMLINTPDGWRNITGAPAPEIRHATTQRELSARMADELAELCPAMGFSAASVAASMLAKTLRQTFA